MPRKRGFDVMPMAQKLDCMIDYSFAVLFLVCPLEDHRRFMLKAQDLGMTNGEYVYYTVDMLPDEDNVNSDAIWRGNDGRDVEAREAFKSVFHVSKLIITYFN
eukprot:GHVO01058150.1.p1 GENE.GHVO01058150.1~~GHVO01058150.1.p1  ORF type:complete len:103 (-),score=7.74 GHVO01058150.1:244-552(-)